MGKEQDLDLIYQAIQKELAENPNCPVVSDLFQPLLEQIQNGDEEALSLALKIAHDTLSPQKPIFSFFRVRK